MLPGSCRVLLVALALLALTACSDGQIEVKKSPVDQRVEVAADPARRHVEALLSRVPRVRQAVVVYRADGSFGSRGELTMNLHVDAEDRKPKDDLLEVGILLAWRSTIDPLERVVVNVYADVNGPRYPSSNEEVASETFDLLSQSADLTAEYGPGIVPRADT